MKLIATLFIALVSHAWGQTPLPEVKKTDGKYQIVVEGLMPTPISLEAAGGTPKVIEIKDAPSNARVRLIVYESGIAGTTALYRIERAIIVDAAKKKVLGDAPLRYVAIAPAEEMIQPQWTWKPASVEIIDEAFGDDLTALF